MKRPSQASIAKAHGINLSTLRRYMAAGVDIYDDDQVTAAKSEKAAKAARGAAANDTPDLARSRARKMQAEAELAEIKLAAAKRDNLPRIEVEEQLIRICRALQVGLDALAGELPPIIAGMDAPAMEPHIKRAHRLLCNAWADGAAEIVGGDWRPPSFDELRENQPK
jgi:hypothetical protein